MSPRDKGQPVDYGNEAVARPAESVLEYGERAVAQGTTVAQAQQRKRRPTQAGVAPNRIVVHSESRVAIAGWRSAVRSSPLSKALKGRIGFDDKTRTITLPDPSAISLGEGEEWISDLLRVGDDWEITTARLVIIVDAQAIRGQRLEPHLRASEERGRIVDADDIDLMPIAADFHRAGPGVLLGKTTPNLRMSDRAPRTEVVRLASNRGLVMIVSEIVVKKGQQVTLDPVRVHRAIMVKNLIHELAAHAGMFAQGRAAEHGDARVERNTKSIDELFAATVTKHEEKLQDAVQAYIESIQKQ